MFTYTHRSTDTVLETKSDTLLDPRRDSVLDPHRFESVWIGTEQEMIFVKENMGLGREKSLIIDENVEIFAAYVPSKYQKGVLYHAFHQHNAEHDKLTNYSCDHVSAVLTNETGSFAEFYGVSYKNALTALSFVAEFVTAEDAKLVPMVLKCILDQLDACVEIVYIPDLQSAGKTVEVLSALAFHVEETGNQNESNAWATVTDLKAALQRCDHSCSSVSSTVNKLERYKEGFAEQEDPEACLKSRREFEKRVKQFVLDFTGPHDNEEEFPSNSTNPTFIFSLAKTENKQVMGGVLCETEGTQLHAKGLWVHESMRGKKFAEKLICLAVEYAKKKGCTDVDLQTTSFQAPLLYPKLGCKQVSFYPMGPHAVYCYKKRL